MFVKSLVEAGAEQPFLTCQFGDVEYLTPILIQDKLKQTS
jgi:hypothetical protein